MLKPRQSYNSNISVFGPPPGLALTTRYAVLVRDGHQCQCCEGKAGQPSPHDPSRRTRIEPRHIIDKSMGGTDDPSNLRAVCSVCNEGASNLTPDRPTVIKLKAQVRRARADDQIALLRWLAQKYPAEIDRLARSPR